MERDQKARRSQVMERDQKGRRAQVMERDQKQKIPVMERDPEDPE